MTLPTIRDQDKRWVVTEQKNRGEECWIKIAPALYAQKPGAPRVGREIAYAKPLPGGNS